MQLAKHYLLPFSILAVLVSLYWIVAHQPWTNFVSLYLGILSGSFFLDIDHLIFWLITNRNLEESKLAQLALKKGQYKSLYHLLLNSHRDHTSLIFHHINFHLVLLAISLFIFTSSESILAKSFVLAINIHLFVDIYLDYRTDYTHLQTWYFARNAYRLPDKYFRILLFSIASLILAFVVFLANS